MIGFVVDISYIGFPCMKLPKRLWSLATFHHFCTLFDVDFDVDSFNNISSTLDPYSCFSTLLCLSQRETSCFCILYHVSYSLRVLGAHPWLGYFPTDFFYFQTFSSSFNNYHFLICDFFSLYQDFSQVNMHHRYIL